MKKKEIEEFSRKLSQRFISVHGDIKPIDEVIDELLKKGDKRKRRFSTG